MSSAPWTFGAMITSSLSPIAGTRVVRSSSTHGESRELIRVQNWVGPKSVSWPILTRPLRAFSLFSALTASSRLPSSTSVVPTMAGIFAAIFSLPGSKKWIAREGRAGISRRGAGAPTASGVKKSLAVRNDLLLSVFGHAKARRTGFTGELSSRDRAWRGSLAITDPRHGWVRWSQDDARPVLVGGSEQSAQGLGPLESQQLLVLPGEPRAN